MNKEIVYLRGNQRLATKESVLKAMEKGVRGEPQGHTGAFTVYHSFHVHMKSLDIKLIGAQ